MLTEIYCVLDSMNQEQKQTFVWNVMKLIVGLILLVISYGYLQKTSWKRFIKCQT